MVARARLHKRRVPKYVAPKGYVYDLYVGRNVRTRAIGYKIGRKFVKKLNEG